jgi:hypothetical protein
MQTTLEETKEIAEEYMKKEIEMLYNISLLSSEDRINFKAWFANHSHYRHLRGLSNQ